MHLLIDLQCCQSSSRLGGIGRYSLDLAKAMVRQFDGEKISILLNDRNTRAELVVRRELRDLIPQSSIHIFPAPEKCYFLHDGGALAADAQIIRNKFIEDLQPDVVHLASLVEGLTEEIVTSIDQDAPWVNAVTVYDLIPLRQPQKYLADPHVKNHYFSKVNQFQNADVLLGISEFSTNEILEHIPDFNGVSENILGGIDPRFQAIPGARKAYSSELEKIGITKPFLMYTASFDARKNQKGLIEAFAKLPKRLRDRHQLVLVGNGWPGIYAELRSVARGLGVAPEALIFPGHVTDELLHILYCSAELFVFPSLWEGLGMPVLEAMACGTPCVGSNTTSVPEVLGLSDAAFDPNNSSEIAALMRCALTDEVFRQQLSAHAISHSSKFSWDSSALKALSAIKSAADEAGKLHNGNCYALIKPAIADLGDIEQLSLAEAKRQLLSDEDKASEAIKIGWLTTWEKRCGLATYSLNLLDDFPHNAIVLGQNSPRNEKFRTKSKISTKRCWDPGKNASLAKVTESIDKLGLTDVVIQFNYGLFNFIELNAFIANLNCLEVNTYIVLHSTKDPSDNFGDRLCDIADGLRAASRVFVHADQDFDRLEQINVTQNVRLIPHGIKVLSTAVQKPLNSRKQTLSIGSYGFFLPHKGLLELIQATRRLIDGGMNVRLKLVNACYGDAGGVSQGLIDEAHALVRQLGLSDHVDLHTDFLSDAESARQLAECDMVAFPYQQTGESASGAIRMALAMGKPILTTPLSIFDDVKNLVFQTNGCDVADIAEGIERVEKALRTKSPELESLMLRVAARVNAHRYEGVARYIATEIATVSLCARSEMIFKSNSSNVKTLNSSWQVDRLVSTGPGIMTFGPHIRLEPGVYKIAVSYSTPTSTDSMNSFARISSMNGQKCLLEFELKQSDRKCITEKYFHLHEAQHAVEVCIKNDADAGTELFEYQISRMLS